MGHLFLCYKKLKLKIKQNPTTFERNALTVFSIFLIMPFLASVQIAIFQPCSLSSLNTMQNLQILFINLSFRWFPPKLILKI